MTSDSCYFFMKSLKMYLKLKYFEVNNESNFHIANGGYNPNKLLKRGQICKNSPYCVSHAVKYVDKYSKISRKANMISKLLLKYIIFLLFLKSFLISFKFDFLEIFWFIWRHAALIWLT
jgi:hypothetical protein